MAVNLIRNSRVFFTTNVDSQGRVRAGTSPLLKDSAYPFTSSNTFEIQVLEGMTFSQNTTIDTVTLNEAGDTPARGQRSFNTALEPVDFSFATYLRPFNTGSAITCEERILWNAFSAKDAIGGTNPGWSETSSKATLVVTNSNKHQLQTFGLIIVFDDLAYVIDNCALDTATIDFGIDAIANVQWAGKGTLIRPVTITASQPAAGQDVVLDGSDLSSAGDAAKAKNTEAKYITNKLTVLKVNNQINDFTDSDYAVPITGGSITLANNLTYLTPANLGVVNLPITYFTGTRSVTGTLTAYLRTGSNSTGSLLSTLLADAATEINPSFAINIQMGGSSGTHVDFKIPAAMLQIPTVNTEQVISTTITFNGQGWSGAAASETFDIESANEISVEYYATT